MTHQEKLDALNPHSVLLANRFHRITKHWPWEISPQKIYWSQGLLQTLINVAKDRPSLANDFELFKAKVEAAVRDRLTRNETEPRRRIPGPAVQDIERLLHKSTRRLRTRRARFERKKSQIIEDNVKDTDNVTEGSTSTSEAEPQTSQYNGRSVQQAGSSSEAVQRQSTYDSCRSSTALTPGIMLTTEIESEPRRCQKCQQVLEFEHLKQEPNDSGLTLGFEYHTCRAPDIRDRSSLSPPPRVGPSPPTINTMPCEQVPHQARHTPVDCQPRPVQLQLEAQLQPAHGSLCTALARLAEDAGNQQEEARAALKQANTDLAGLTMQLQTVGESTGGAAKSAEAELADAAIEAKRAEEAFIRLQACFIPKNDAEKAIIDQRAADVAAAKKRRDNAAARLREGRHERGIDDAGSAEQLRQQQARLLASIRVYEDRLQASVQEGKAVKLFQSVIQLGPARFHHMLHLSQLAFPFEAGIQKYIEDSSVGPLD